MNITSAQYTTAEKEMIKATIDGTEMCVPLDPDNTDYAEILKQVQEGTLTIQDAD
jgi:hypothetical protein